VHIPTHILSGWCLADQVKFTARERLFCMMAATLADLDGVGRIFGEEWYWRFHHRLGHNVFYAVAMAGILAWFSKHRAKAFWFYLMLAHLHLLLDYYGSGPLWHIHYFWPVSDYPIRNPRAWEFFSWQNLVTFGVFLVWTGWIAVTRGRTPLETMTPEWDRSIVKSLRRIYQPQMNTDEHG
jgi:inner membrane protein